MITGIGHIAFRVTEIEPALNFYCNILGFREAFRLEREGNRSPWIVYIQVAPGQFIELFPFSAKAGPQPGEDAGYSHFSLTVDDIHSTVRLLGERGLRTEGEPTQGLDGNFQYWITDPDGNRIELMQINANSPHAAADASWNTAR